MWFITSIASTPKRTINWILVVATLLLTVTGVIFVYQYVDENYNEKMDKKYKTLPVAKDFTLKKIEKIGDNSLVLTSDYKLFEEKTPFVLLHFWASWCVPCTVELPLYKDIARKFDPKIFKIVGVLSYDSLADVAKSRLLETFAYTQLFDLYGEAAFLFKIKNLPTSFLLNANRQIIFSLDEPLNEVSVKNFYAKLEKIVKGYRSEQEKSK